MKYLKYLSVILFLALASLFLSPFSFGDTPTPVPNMANCDACGYCQDTKTLLEEIWESEGKDKAVEWERWVANWRKCQKCLYPNFAGEVQPDNNLTLINLPTPYPERYYTAIGCISTKPGEFTRQLSDFFFRLVGGVAFLFLLYGAGVVITSKSDPERLNQGKRIIYGAIIGLLFVLLSTFLFNFIANTVLRIPGFGE